MCNAVQNKLVVNIRSSGVSPEGKKAAFDVVSPWLPAQVAPQYQKH